jgi:uncharacterized protein YqgC (DUF456 family)
MEWLVAVAVAVGIVGVVVPVLPGLLLVAAAIGAWAVGNDAWWLLAAVVLLSAVTLGLKVALPARAARDSASTAALVVGAVAALVGFFVIPVVGMVVGFLVGVLAVELIRLRDPAGAWRATWATARSIGITMAIELAACIVMAGLWAGALLLG